jgi:NAD+ synthase (glutamine-hydrolysing)
VPTLRIALAQLDFLVGDVSGNLERIASACEEARDRLAANLVLFPELAMTGYPPEDLLLRPEFVTASARALEVLATRVRGVTAIVGLPRRRAGALYNSAAVIRDGRVLGCYDKEILPNYGVFDEQRYFQSSTEALVVDVEGLAVGVTICEDIWQPGPVGRAAAAGAHLLVNLNASPYHAGKVHERDAVLRDRVADSGLPIVYLNLVGGQDELVFDGGSLVMDGAGHVVCRFPQFQDGLFLVEVASERAATTSICGAVHAWPDDVESVYRAVVLGTRDYVRKNGFPGVVLGLSGGVDSALTLAIACDALGSEQVEAVLLPSRFTADMSISDAREQCRRLAVRERLVPIEPSFRAILETLAPVFADRAWDTTEENIQARCRGIILMAISNKTGRMVLSTSNKSETAVGYSTLYGDMAGGFAPIKDVPKTLVYRLCDYRNAIESVIPDRVLDRPPSAELRDDQKDQDSLPPYEILDPILQMYVERDCSTEEIIAAGFERDTVQRVARLVIMNEYKRRQAAPGVRITPRAFGRDRRYPITSGFGRFSDN